MEEAFTLIISYWQIILLFFIIAVLYASVGFGGGSSYLAVLALTTIAFSQIRATALLCNIVVVTGNVFLFQQKKMYQWKKIIPLVLFSIPMSFLGGYLKISQTFFFILLAITLLFAASTMWISKKIHPIKSAPKSTILKDMFYGGIIGFISGMVGIGGGIFLAPILYLTGWDTPKKIAALASFFILINSISGFLGQVINPDFNINWNITVLLIITVFIGGQVGSRLSNTFFTPLQLKKATAILIAMVGFRILWNYLF